MIPGPGTLRMIRKRDRVQNCVRAVLASDATPLPCLCGQLPSSRNDPRQPNNQLQKSRHNSTNIDLIQKAIKDIKLREEGASFSYREVAKRHGISYRTLARRH